MAAHAVKMEELRNRIAAAEARQKGARNIIQDNLQKITTNLQAQERILVVKQRATAKAAQSLRAVAPGSADEAAAQSEYNHCLDAERICRQTVNNLRTKVATLQAHAV